MFVPVGFFAPTGAAPGPIVTTNLEQWFDVETGTQAGTLADSSGNGRNGTLTNGELVYNTTNDWWDIDATDFNPQVDTGYRIGDYAANSWTIECWFNITSITGVATGIAHNRGGVYSTNYIAMAANGTTGDVSINLINSAAGEYAIAGNNGSSIVDSNWHHVAATYDSGTSTMTLYLDTTSIGTSAVAGTCDRAENLHYMGKFLNSGRYFSNASFGSYRHYSAALSSTEVAQNYNAEKAHYGL